MSQLALFEAPPRPIKRDRRDILFEFAMSDAFKQELLELARQRANEWVEPSDFYRIAKRNDVGSYFGHALYQLARDGKLQAKDVYFGSDHPGKANYLGYKTVYMYAEGVPA